MKNTTISHTDSLQLKPTGKSCSRLYPQFVLSVLVTRRTTRSGNNELTTLTNVPHKLGGGSGSFLDLNSPLLIPNYMPRYYIVLIGDSINNSTVVSSG